MFRLSLTALLFFGAAFVHGAPAAPPAAETSWTERPTRVPPFFWYEKDPELDSRFLMISPLYWEAERAGTFHQLLLPVFYRWREEDRSLLVSLPLVFSYRRPEERWTLAGLYYRRRTPEITHTALFPLYWQKSRANGGRVTAALPFLFYDYRSHDRRRMDQIFLGGWRRRRGPASMGLVLNYGWMRDEESRFSTLFPFYWHTRSPQERLDAFGPLYFRRSRPAWKPAPFLDKAEVPPEPGARIHAGLFPLVGGGWGGGTLSHYLFPIHYYSRDAEQNALLTLPASSFRRGARRRGHLGLYYYSHDPDHRSDGVFPLWFRGRAEDGFDHTLQVLNFYRRRENEDAFQTLFPLYGYWSNPQESRFLSWGVWRRRTPEASTGWAYLYHWKRAADGDRTRVLFPLYWHFRRQPDWQVDVLFPLYTRYHDQDTTVTAIPPVIWKKSPERSTFSLFFLYWRDQQEGRGSTTLLPFFHDNQDPRRRMFFSPLAWTRRSALSREGLVPPVYWYRSAEVRRLALFPIYWGVRGPDRRQTILPPYYRFEKKDRASLGLFPLWGRHRGPNDVGSYLFPFYWHSGNGKGDGLWVIPPILGFLAKHGSGTDNPQVSFQYLLFGNVRSAPRSLEHEFFPLYKYLRREDYVNFWAPRGLALTAWERNGPRRKGYVFPYAWGRAPERDWDWVLPLWWSSRSYEVLPSTPVARGPRAGGSTVFFPLVWAGRNADRAYRLFLPLYARYEEPKENRRFSAVTPVWMSYDTPRGGAFRMLFPLYWRFHMEKAPEELEEGQAEKRDIAVLGPFYRVDAWHAGRKSRTVGLAPLVARTAAGPDDNYFELLGGLFARDVQGGRRRFRIFYFFYTPARELRR